MFHLSPLVKLAAQAALESAIGLHCNLHYNRELHAAILHLAYNSLSEIVRSLNGPASAAAPGWDA